MSESSFPSSSADDTILPKQAKLLQGIAEAARYLLSVSDIDTAVNGALEAIATAAQIDRIYILEYLVADSPEIETVVCPYEWAVEGCLKNRESLNRFPMSPQGFESWLDDYKLGRSAQGLGRDLMGLAHAARLLEPALARLMVPIRVEGQYWGVIGLDDCRTERVWSDAEIATLETAAACLGSSLERNLNWQRQDVIAQVRTTELENHNQILEDRDRILVAMAEAENVLLTLHDFDSAVNTALQIVGQGLDVDRILLGEHFEAESDPKTGFCRFLYEWHGSGISSQLAHAHLNPISDQGIEFIHDVLRVGHYFGGVIDDLPDPFRRRQKELGVKSTYAIPIMVNNSYWGVITFDDCRRSTHRREAELAILQTLANCIGNAIDRERHRQEQALVAQARAAELETYNRQLQQRDSLLNSVNAAAQCLVANEELDNALPILLKILGEGTGQSRSYILKNSRDGGTGNLLFNLMLEWDAPNIPTKIDAGGTFPVPIDHFPDHLTAPLKAGRVTQFLARDLEGIDTRKQGQALSLVGVPINVAGEWWGLLGLDDCINERVWSEAEIAVLETAATAIGNAIERDRTRKAREAAERIALIETERAARAAELEVANQILSARERWLNATAAAANELLSTADVEVSVNAALKTIGENLECDRIGVMRHVPEQSGLGRFSLLYEWHSPYTISQLVDPQLAHIPASDFEDWARQLMAGQWAGGIISKQREPFRSKMQALNTLTAYAVPIFVETRFWGLMFMDNCRELRQLTPAELAVFRTAATCVGSAIHQDQMRQDRQQTEREALLKQEREQSVQEQAAELAKANEAIRRTLSALTAKPELNDFLGQLLAEITQQVAACKAHLFLYDAKTHTLKQYIAVQEGQVYLGNAPTDPAIFHSPVPADLSGAWQTIINSPRPFTWDENSPQAVDLYWPESIPWHQAEGHQSAVCACMRVGNRAIGFIGFAFRHLASLTDKQLDFIQALTNQATLAIQLTRLAEENKNTALLDERNRLAREIHDTLAQTFTGISLQLEAAKGLLSNKPDEAKLFMNRAGDLARRGLFEAQRSVQALRSLALETDTLPEAFQNIIQDLTQTSDVQGEFHLIGSPYALNDELQANLLRIGQEAITNVLRHAKAQTLKLTLIFAIEQVRLYITDDGQGVDVTDLEDIKGFGLMGMRERTLRFGGQFHFSSHPGKGTAIDIIIPMESVK